MLICWTIFNRYSIWKLLIHISGLLKRVSSALHKLPTYPLSRHRLFLYLKYILMNLARMRLTQEKRRILNQQWMCIFISHHPDWQFLFSSWWLSLLSLTSQYRNHGYAHIQAWLHPYPWFPFITYLQRIFKFVPLFVCLFASPNLNFPSVLNSTLWEEIYQTYLAS